MWTASDAWLLDNVGKRFMVLLYVTDLAQVEHRTVERLRGAGQWPAGPSNWCWCLRTPGAAPQGIRLLEDRAGRFAERFDARPGTAYLIRPDQHVAARWRSLDAAHVAAALARATCNTCNKEFTMSLNLKPNFTEPGKRYFHAFTPGDDFYEALIDTHRDLSDEQSAMVNAKLMLLLANHMGDISVLREAMHIARRRSLNEHGKGSP